MPRRIRPHKLKLLKRQANKLQRTNDDVVAKTEATRARALDKLSRQHSGLDNVKIDNVVSHDVGRATTRARVRKANIVSNLSGNVINGVKPGRALASRSVTSSFDPITDKVKRLNEGVCKDDLRKTESIAQTKVAASPFRIAGHWIICDYSLEYGNSSNLMRYGFRYNRWGIEGEHLPIWTCRRHELDRIAFLVDFPELAEYLPIGDISVCCTNLSEDDKA